MIWVEALGTVLASFGVALGVSLLPLGGGVEAYLLTTSALLPAGFVGPLVLASAAGSVAAKAVVYLGITRATGRNRTVRAGKSAKLVARIQEGPWVRRSVILASTTVSVPPYYALSVAAGMLRTPFAEFLAVSMIGQSLRFGFVWAVPQIAERLAAVG